jgi:hypothetical protein
MFCAQATGFALTEEQMLHGNKNFQNTSESLNARSRGMKVSIKVLCRYTRIVLTTKHVLIKIYLVADVQYTGCDSGE